MNTVNQVHYCPCCVGFNRTLTLMANSQKADKFISSRIENIKAINNNNVRIMARKYQLAQWFYLLDGDVQLNLSILWFYTLVQIRIHQLHQCK